MRSKMVAIPGACTPFKGKELTCAMTGDAWILEGVLSPLCVGHC